MMPRPCSSTRGVYVPLARRAERFVHCCPDCGTYWRSSSQTGQSSRATAYCMPQAWQIGSVLTAISSRNVQSWEDTLAGANYLVSA